MVVINYLHDCNQWCFCYHFYLMFKIINISRMMIDAVNFEWTKFPLHDLSWVKKNVFVSSNVNNASWLNVSMSCFRIHWWHISNLNWMITLSMSFRNCFNVHLSQKHIQIRQIYGLYCCICVREFVYSWNIILIDLILHTYLWVFMRHSLTVLYCKKEQTNSLNPFKYS